jgi:hypothetical protein
MSFFMCGLATTIVGSHLPLRKEITMSPDERAWMQALQQQTDKNTAAILANGEALKHIADSVTLAHSLLVAVGKLCAEVASDAEDPHGRLEKILAGFEASMLEVFSQEASPPGLRERGMRQMDLLRHLAEDTLQTKSAPEA